MSSQIEAQLLRLKREAEEREARRLAEKYNLEYLDLLKKPIQTDALKLLPEDLARKARMAAVEIINNEVVVAVIDPEKKEVKIALEQLKAANFIPIIYITTQSGLENVWFHYEKLFHKPATTGGMDIEKERIEDLYQKLTDLQAIQKEVDNFDFKNLPTAFLLEIFLSGALVNRASDIHFEPELDNIKVRYRIDGVLYDVANFSSDFYKLILARVKYFSRLKLNIIDRPQDGRFTIGLTSKKVEVRVSVIPSEYGETTVLRLLDPEAISVSLEDLGLRKDDMDVAREVLSAPNGMILNTGPTGSGKTTTLYAFLKKRQTSQIKIITIEDPIEYHLEGIEQTQVSAGGDYNFSNGLRAILRQDPDIILIGEIRDQETAGIAIQAALTGHLVFSTVHANEAAGAIPRLLDLNVKSSSIGPALNLIMAQRLARRLCGDCKKAKDISSDLNFKIDNFLKTLPPKAEKPESFQLYEPVGCDKCGHRGFKGRVGVFELLKVDEKIESLINQQAGETEIQKFAIENGMITMQQDGFLKALRGITTLEEIEIATGKFVWNL